MFYAVRHFTRFRYSRPISQSVMEVRMHPRSEYAQRCFTFQLSVSPRARIFTYTDHLGNAVHHFDIPASHGQLTIIADALVEVAKEFGVDRRNEDPLMALQKLNSQVYNGFSYVKASTSVDSPIEDALQSRQGVCQDFAHIMIALVRGLRIPCRYVSGYLHHESWHLDRSGEGATHAWVEALLPGVGWVGFDPTNNLLAGERHIRTAIGRDYADVPPTMGTMKGRASSELQVRVRVTPSEAILPPDQEFAADEEWSRFLEKDQEAELVIAQQQQQQ